MSEHYFSPAPSTKAERTEREVRIRGVAHRILTSPGVFSASGLDKATAVLLGKVPFEDIDAPARVLDVGCGWGPISLALADAFPQAELWATDVNERARELTLANLELAGHSGTVLTPEEAFARLEPGSVDLIVSNPPIRIGKQALHELLLANLALLSPEGRAWLVVGKNLGADSLASWLTGQGHACRKLGSAKGFRVLEVLPAGTAPHSKEA